MAVVLVGIRTASLALRFKVDLAQLVGVFAEAGIRRWLARSVDQVNFIGVVRLVVPILLVRGHSGEP